MDDIVARVPEADAARLAAGPGPTPDRTLPGPAAAPGAGPAAGTADLRAPAPVRPPASWLPRLRHLARWMLALPLYYGGALVLYRRWRAGQLPRGELLVLRYHRVIPDSEPEPIYRLGVHRRSFAAQVAHLAARTCVVDLAGPRRRGGGTGGRFYAAYGGLARL